MMDLKKNWKGMSQAVFLILVFAGLVNCYVVLGEEAPGDEKLLNARNYAYASIAFLLVGAVAMFPALRNARPLLQVSAVASVVFLLGALGNASMIFDEKATDTKRLSDAKNVVIVGVVGVIVLGVVGWIAANTGSYAENISDKSYLLSYLA